MSISVHPRVAALVERFLEIDTTMRDLPLYNAKLTVEAYDFRPYESQDLVGILITPWFMNLLLLPLTPSTIDPNRYGEARRIALPGGERNFLYGGDDAIGSFWAASLHSPMETFVVMAQARAEARLRREEALTPPPETATVGTAAHTKPPMSRRAFLRGA